MAPRKNEIVEESYYTQFPKLSFPFFYYHKINLHLIGISIFEQLFFLCFLKYEYFWNCQQSHYRNTGYFEGICKCENLTFHLQTEKDVKFVSEMVCWHECVVVELKETTASLQMMALYGTKDKI
jgi:hypothetical protein